MLNFGIFHSHCKPEIPGISRVSGGPSQSPSARLSSNAERHARIAFPARSSPPHEAPNAIGLFPRALPNPQRPSFSSTYSPLQPQLKGRYHPRPAPPPHQLLPRKRPKPGAGATARPGAGRVAIGPERDTWLGPRRTRVRRVALRACDGTTRRGGARPRPPARPPPLGLPLRPRGASRAARPLSGGRARPGVAVSTREAGLWGGRHGGRGGAVGPREGCGARPALAGVDEARCLNWVALRGSPRLDRLSSRPGGWRHRSSMELLSWRGRCWVFWGYPEET